MCATFQSCIGVSEYLLFQCNNSPFCARSPEMFKIRTPLFQNTTLIVFPLRHDVSDNYTARQQNPIDE
jgi:hypothetical protein